LSHQYDVGYDLQTSLLVSDQGGAPLSPVCQNLVTQEGTHSTRAENILPEQSHLDELKDRIKWLEEQNWQKKPVHIIDREGDSAHLLRCMNKTGSKWLIRGKSNHKLLYNNKELSAAEIAKQLSFSDAGTVKYKGQKAGLKTAETDVVLTRKHYIKTLNKKGGYSWIGQAGEAVKMRLVVARVVDNQANILAEWLLLSNVENAVGSKTIAEWYYWRWKIETYFKLLKSAGHQLEHWQQQTGIAIARRLVIAAHACVVVWRLARCQDSKSIALKRLLIELSGRQMKYNKPVTESALLAGLWTFLSMTMVRTVSGCYSPIIT
jgi:hypothetical protein